MSSAIGGRARAVAIGATACVLLLVFLLLVATFALVRANSTEAAGWVTGTGASAPSALALAVAGAVLTALRPRLLMGWLLLGGAFAFAVDAAGGQYLAWASITHPGSPYDGWLQGVTRAGGTVSGLALPAVLLVFPDGRLPSRRWRIPAGLAALAVVYLVLVTVLTPLRVAARVYSIDVPAATIRLADSVTPHLLDDGLWSGLLHTVPFFAVPLLLLPVAACVARYRRVGIEARAQLRWVFLGGFLALAAAGVAPLLPEAVYPLVSLLGTAAFCAGVLIGVVRYRLYDIDIVLNRGLLFGLLSLVIVAVYLAVVALLSTLVPGGHVDVRGLIAAAAVAMVVAPARARLSRLADRVVRGVTGDPYGVMATLAQRLEASVTTQDLLEELAATLARAFGCPYVSVALTQGSGVRVELGHPLPTVEQHRLMYRGIEVGTLRLSLPKGTRLRAAERRLLDDLVRQAGVAAHAVARTEELLHGRELLVSAREEERRRIRRDLHDGLGPVLGALTLKLDAARNVGVSEADTILQGAKADVRAAITDLRSLVHDLRPPTLDDLGLVAALEQQFSQHSRRAGFVVRVASTGDLSDLPAAVEVAAFRIASEAVTNAVRHSGGTQCDVLLERTARGPLVVTVCDDGSGIPPVRQPGLGLVSMRERAVELGGDLELGDGERGGARVVGTLPAPRLTVGVSS